MKRALTGFAAAGLLVALAPALHQVADAQPCPPSQPPGRPPGQPVGGDSGRPDGYGPGVCQLLLSQSSGSAGTSFSVSGSGFGPGTDVTVTFESDPVVLAVVTADSSGNFSAGVAVPEGAEPGRHTVRATGVGADGEPHSQSADFTVVGDRAAGGSGDGTSGDASATGSGDAASNAPADDGAPAVEDGDATEGPASPPDGGATDREASVAAGVEPAGSTGGGSSTLAGVGLGAAVVAVVGALVLIRRRRPEGTAEVT